VISAVVPSAVSLAVSSALLATGLYVYGQSSSTRPDTQQRSTSGERWEYLIVAGGTVSVESSGYGSGRKQKIFQAEASAVERNLDALGEEGWELVTVGNSPEGPSYFLKRPKRR
jgi:hypothetical protein